MITGALVGTTIHIAFIGLPQRSDPRYMSTLEPMEYEVPANVAEEQTSRTPKARSLDVSPLYINLMVWGLGAIFQTAKRDGFCLYRSVFMMPEEALEAKVGGRRICCVRGPNGETVELTEIPKKGEGQGEERQRP